MDISIQSNIASNWFIPGLIKKGVTLLSGSPYTGKSFFCLDIALAVATGGNAINAFPSPKAGVLYLALTDNEQRIKNRLTKLLKNETASDDLQNLYFATEWERGITGLKFIRKHIKEHPNCKLIIIDLFAYLRTKANTPKKFYTNNCMLLNSIKQLSNELNISIILTHHYEDPIFDKNTKSFTPNDLPCLIDTTLLIRRNGQKKDNTLYMTEHGISASPKPLLLKFASCKWHVSS